MTDDLERRLDAVERAITGDDRPVADLADAAELSTRVERLAERTEALEERLADLEAAVRALRGYVGHERANGGRPEGEDPSAPEGADDDDPRVAPHETDDHRDDGVTDRGPDQNADRTGPTGVDAPRAEDGADGGTRRVDVDTGEEWPTSEGDRSTPDRTTDNRASGPNAADGARDVRRLDPKPGGASETDGENRSRDETASGDSADVARRGDERTSDETVAWDWDWTTEADATDVDQRERPDGAGGREQSRPGPGSAGSRDAAPGAVDGRDRTRRASDDGRRETSGRWAVASDDGGESSPGTEQGWSDGSAAWDPSGSADRCPDPGGPDPVDDRRPETSEGWPEGLDVERAQPWSVPDPPRVAAEEREEDDGLLERLREAL